MNNYMNSTAEKELLKLQKKYNILDDEDPLFAFLSVTCKGISRLERVLVESLNMLKATELQAKKSELDLIKIEEAMLAVQQQVYTNFNQINDKAKESADNLVYTLQQSKNLIINNDNLIKKFEDSIENLNLKSKELKADRVVFYGTIAFVSVMQLLDLYFKLKGA